MKNIFKLTFLSLILTTCIACNSASAQSNKVTPISDESFIKNLGSGISIVDFWASWCRPCLSQAPIYEQVATEIGSKAKFFKLDVDSNKKTASQYNVSSIPTIIIFKKGKEVKRFVGVTDKETLLKEIKKVL